MLLHGSVIANIYDCTGFFISYSQSMNGPLTVGENKDFIKK